MWTRISSVYVFSLWTSQMSFAHRPHVFVDCSRSTINGQWFRGWRLILSQFVPRWGIIINHMVGRVNLKVRCEVVNKETKYYLCYWCEQLHPTVNSSLKPVLFVGVFLLSVVSPSPGTLLHFLVYCWETTVALILSWQWCTDCESVQQCESACRTMCFVPCIRMNIVPSNHQTVRPNAPQEVFDEMVSWCTHSRSQTLSSMLFSHW